MIDRMTMRLLTTLAAVVAATPALAERVEDRFWLSGDALFATAKSTLRLDRLASTNPGTEVGFERELGLDSHATLPVVLGGVRLGKGWRLEAEHLRLKRSGSALLDRNITVGDTVYAANIDIASSLATETYRVVGGYAPLRNDRGELGVSLGAHVTKFRAEISGVGSINGGPASVIVKQVQPTAPLPTIGLYGNYALSKLFTLQARADYLSIKIGDYKGKLIDVKGSVSIRPIEHVNLGAGYRYVEYGLSANKASFDGRIKYRFHGPVAFAELTF